jgi:hypothetical protein
MICHFGFVCELQLEVFFNSRLNWNLGQMEASMLNMPSCAKIYAGHKKLRETKVLRIVKHNRTKD